MAECELWMGHPEPANLVLDLCYALIQPNKLLHEHLEITVVFRLGCVDLVSQPITHTIHFVRQAVVLEQGNQQSKNDGETRYADAQVKRIAHIRSSLSILPRCGLDTARLT
jgi:hypothetical protein